MRWNEKEQPNHGDTRIVEGFLWFPEKLNGETRWLEKAKWEEKAYGVQRVLTKESAGTRWYPVRWIND